MQGFLNLNKPAGLTSHDCVARVRRLLRQKRVGHGGTLDPAATGVLPIAVGKATRLLQYLSHQKAYRATVRLGIVTTTDDLEGEVIRQTSAAELTLAQIEPVLPQFIGQIEQIPPSYSAIQVGGKRLYDLARSGQMVTAPARTVVVHQIAVLDWRSGEFPELDLAIDCGPGTYIRSIARDLGAALGCGGTLAGLVRTTSSGFTLSRSLSLEQVAEQVEGDRLQLIPPQIALAHLPVIGLTQPQIKLWQQGQRLDWQQLVEPPDFETLQTTPCLVVRHAAHSHSPDSSSAPIDPFLGIGQAVMTQVQGQSVKLLIPKLVW